MSQATEVNNQDRYKSYIQKRRVGSDSSEDNFSAEIKSEKSPLSNIEDLSLYKENKTYEGFSRASSFNDHTSYRNQRFRTDTGPFKFVEDKNRENSYSGYNPYSNQSRHSSRIDTSIYQRKRPASYGMSNRTAIEENKATLLAIKIIKQALACFAILGLIVFLQQRTDTAGALTFIKSHVVDNHTDVSTLISGVENIIAECSRLFGGSP